MTEAVLIESGKYYPNVECSGVVVAVGADFEDYTKVIKINELLKDIHNITWSKYLSNPYTQRICGYDKQLFETGTCRKKYKCLYVYHLQCLVSNGETTSLVLVKGCANIGLVQKIKKKFDKNSRN